MNTEKPIPLKDGTTLPAGLPVEFIKDSPSRCLVRGNRELPFRVRVASAFEPPSAAELEEAMTDGTCPSIAGHTVEPDGWDHEETPSWLLALGLI